MKKLGKLSINVDKIIKNEELVNLKGGEYSGYEGACTCTCYNVRNLECLGYLASDTGYCAIECNEFYGPDILGGCGQLRFCFY